jgi:hypothetical protein
MRRALTTLALAVLFGPLMLSNVTRAGCPHHAARAHPPCRTPECVTRCFARWDACREKFGEKFDKAVNPPWLQACVKKAPASE